MLPSSDIWAHFITSMHMTKMSTNQFQLPFCWDSHHSKINNFILLYKCHIYFKNKFPQPIIVNALIIKHTFMILILLAQCCFHLKSKHDHNNSRLQLLTFCVNLLIHSKNTHKQWFISFYNTAWNKQGRG